MRCLCSCAATTMASSARAYIAAANYVCCNAAATVSTAVGSQAQVQLPSARQLTNATDTMSPMLLWNQSSRSAEEHEDIAEKGRQASGQRARPVRIHCKQSGVEEGAERMVMSGDLGSQVPALLSVCLSECYGNQRWSQAVTSHQQCSSCKGVTTLYIPWAQPFLILNICIASQLVTSSMTKRGISQRYPGLCYCIKLCGCSQNHLLCHARTCSKYQTIISVPVWISSQSTSTQKRLETPL